MGLVPLVDAAASGRFADLKAQRADEVGFVWIAWFLAVVGGAFLLYGFNWGRWLLVLWMGCHVVISALHSPRQLLMHTLLFAVILYSLFHPQASAYFRGARAEPP